MDRQIIPGIGFDDKCEREEVILSLESLRRYVKGLLGWLELIDEDSQVSDHSLIGDTGVRPGRD